MYIWRYEKNAFKNKSQPDLNSSNQDKIKPEKLEKQENLEMPPISEPSENKNVGEQAEQSMPSEDANKTDSDSEENSRNNNDSTSQNENKTFQDESDSSKDSKEDQDKSENFDNKQNSDSKPDTETEKTEEKNYNKSSADSSTQEESNSQDREENETETQKSKQSDFKSEKEQSNTQSNKSNNSQEQTEEQGDNPSGIEEPENTSYAEDKSQTNSESFSTDNQMNESENSNKENETETQKQKQRNSHKESEQSNTQSNESNNSQDQTESQENTSSESKYLPNNKNAQTNQKENMNSQNTEKEKQESNKRNTKSESNKSNLDKTSETSSSKDKNSNVEENTSNQKNDSSQETENSETQQESNQEKTSSEDTKENNIKDNKTNQSNSEENPSPSEEAKKTRENQENKDLEDNQSAKEANESKDENQEEKKTIEDTQETSNSSETLESRKESLERLKESIKHYAQKKQQVLRKDLLGEQIKNPEEQQKEETDYQNKFLEELKKDLPSFKERNRGDGYSIDTNGTTELPNSLVRTLITKFLNQRFCKKNSDLNVHSNSLEKTDGFYKWNVKNIIVHLKTNQLNKVLNDKYGYDYDSGMSEFVPLSFYFDMSGSMSRYTNMLAVLAIELLKKDVKVLIGFNEKVNVQIDRIASTMDIKELASILSKAGYSSSYGGQKNDIRKDSRISCKFIERNIDNYLIEKQAEKCVVFADCDPIDEVITLSKYAEVYWFCFETQLENEDLAEYEGFLYQVENAQNIAEGLVKVSEKRFESLVFLDNPKILQKEE